MLILKSSQYVSFWLANVISLLVSEFSCTVFTDYKVFVMSQVLVQQQAEGKGLIVLIHAIGHQPGP